MRRIAVSTLVLLALGGCSFLQADLGISVELEGTAWTAQSIAGLPAAPAAEPTIEFADVGVRGSTGCNEWGGRPVWTSDGRFSILDISTTKRACDENDAQQELAFLTILRSTRSLILRGNLLVIGGVDGEIVFGPGVGLGGALDRA